MRRLAAPAATALTMIGVTTAPAASAQPVQVACDPAALAAAITGAPDGSAISLTPGCTYLLTSALPEVTRSLTIDGNGATLDRSPSAPHFIILTDASPSLTVNDLSFTDGNNAITQLGDGALFVNGGTFTGNSASFGGAISSHSKGSDPLEQGPQITGATFTGNSAGSGGAIAYDSFAAYIEITDCRFEGNTAGDGGAVWLFDEAGGVDHSVLTGNYASNDGGAVWSSADSGEGLNFDTITGNAAKDDGGGSYSAEGGGPAQFVNTTVTWNQAGQDGGGAWIGDGDPADVFGSVLAHNTARRDGGGYWLTDGGTALFRNSQVTANGAGRNGGGIWDAGVLETTGGSVTGNLAAKGGGGIYADPEAIAEGNVFIILSGTPVTGNRPDNCEPAGTVTGCSGLGLSPARPGHLSLMLMSACSLIAPCRTQASTQERACSTTSFALGRSPGFVTGRPQLAAYCARSSSGISTTRGTVILIAVSPS